jgi:hypothetical protein
VVLLADTEGLQWELTEIFMRRAHEKTIVFFPPVNHEQKAALWKVFVGRLRQLETGPTYNRELFNIWPNFPKDESLPLAVTLDSAAEAHFYTWAYGGGAGFSRLAKTLACHLLHC